MNKLIVNTCSLAAFALFGFINNASAAAIVQDSGPLSGNIEYYDPIGQTFTATDALLGSIGFGLFDNNLASAVNESLTVTLYEGIGYGGAVLGAVTQTIFDGTLGGTAEFVDFDFSDTALNVGSTYSVKLVSNGGANDLSFAYIADPTAYNEGYLLNGYRTVTSCAGGGCDMMFRVLPAAVPIPAAVWLLGSALVGLAGIGRRKTVIQA